MRNSGAAACPKVFKILTWDIEFNVERGVLTDFVLPVLKSPETVGSFASDLNCKRQRKRRLQNFVIDADVWRYPDARTINTAMGNLLQPL